MRSRSCTALYPVPHRISAAVTNTPRYRHTLPVRSTPGTSGTLPEYLCILLPVRTTLRSRRWHRPDIHVPENIWYPVRNHSPDPVSELLQEVFQKFILYHMEVYISRILHKVGGILIVILNCLILFTFFAHLKVS